MKHLHLLKYVPAMAVLTLLVIFTIFYRLDANPLYIWDEARVAVNALEMSQSHNYLIPTYEGQPDMWNVKPPLMIIIQSFSMDIFGYNELGARMPTAIAALATVCLLLWFSISILKNFLAGFCSVLFLCTAGGYICLHVARSGDYDTLLIFFLTAYFLFGLTYLITRQYKYYLLFSVFLLLSLFTKGIAGAFFLPGLFILYVTEKGLFKELLKLKHLAPPLLAIAAIIAYYIIREQYNSGYINTVFFEEMKGRLSDPGFDTGNTWYFFIDEMVKSNFNPWWIFAVLAIPVYAIATADERKLIRGVFYTLFIFWIPLTISVNKNYWYFAPSYPLLSLAGAFAFSKIYSLLTQGLTNVIGKTALITLVIVLISILPFHNIFYKRVMDNDRRGFAELVKSKKIPSGAIIISNRKPNSTALFYKEALKSQGILIGINHANDVKHGDIVIATSENEVNDLRNRFQYNSLYKFLETEMFYLKSKN